MRLCASAALVLLLGLTWTRADPSPTEGSELCIKLHTIMDKSEILGKFHFLVGYTDNDVSKIILRTTSSVWANMDQVDNGIKITQFNKINGTCHKTRSNVDMSGDRATILVHGVQSEMELLHFSNTSVVMDIRYTTSNISHFLEKFHLSDIHHDGDDINLNAHSYYLIGKESVVSDIDLERFKAHAKCAGFPGEPDFIQKSDKEDCSEADSVLTNDDA